MSSKPKLGERELTLSQRAALSRIACASMLAFSALQLGTGVLAAESSSSVASPVAQSLVNRVLDTARPSFGAETECTEDASLRPSSRVLTVDLALAGKAAEAVGSQLHLGTNCRISILSDPIGSALSITSNATFDDAWLAPFDVADTHLDDWTDKSGVVSKVEMMSRRRCLLYFGRYDDNVLVMLPFRDPSYGLFVMTGPSVSESSAHAYFRSDRFKRYADFGLGFVDVSVPRLALHEELSYCIGACSEKRVQQKSVLSLDEAGAGSAPVLPELVAKSAYYQNFIFWTPTQSQATHAIKTFPSATVAANRPFYLVLVNGRTRDVLFESLVESPNE